jgi:tyrosyl-tRNA synthetase
MEQKKELGVRVISEFHSSEAARQAKAEFERVHQQRQLPSEMQELQVAVGDSMNYWRGSVQVDLGQVKEQRIKLDRFLAGIGLASSVSEAARKLREGAVSINGERCRELLYHLDTSRRNELVIQLGRHHLKVVMEPQTLGDSMNYMKD